MQQLGEIHLPYSRQNDETEQSSEKREEGESPTKFGKGIVSPKDRIVEELKNSFTWIEDMKRDLGWQEAAVFKGIDDFIKIENAKDSLHRTTHEIKSHFVSWFRMERDKEKRKAEYQKPNDPNRNLPNETTYDEDTESTSLPSIREIKERRK